MEFREGRCKAVWVFIAVFGADVNDFLVGGNQFHTGQGQSAATDIFAQCDAEENAESPLEMITGGKALLCDFCLIQRMCQMGFNIVDGALHSGNPVHVLLYLLYLP